MKSMDAWICCSCLVDNVGPWHDNFGEKEATELDPGASTSQDVSLSGEMNNVCSVCCIEDIPVGGEHVCTVCKNALHAWCSNHEDITTSSELVCNYCLE